MSNNKRTMDHIEEAKAKSIDGQIEADEQLLKNASDEGHAAGAEKVIVSTAITADAVADRISQVVQSAATLFYEPEQRILADNGKAYPIDWSFDGRDYHSTEEVVTVDKYGFLDRQFARLQCSGLEMLLRQQNEKIEQQRTRIAGELRFGRNAGQDVAGRVESMANFLGTMIEQAALVEVALKAAVEAFALEFGETYVTKEQAAQVAASRSASLPTDTKAKLAALGVNVG